MNYIFSVQKVRHRNMCQFFGTVLSCLLSIHNDLIDYFFASVSLVYPKNASHAAVNQA